MIRRDNDWTTYIAEINISDGYSVEVGYVQHDSQELYVRLWRGEDFVLGSWHTDFKKKDGRHIQALSDSITQECIECAERIKKLAIFL